MKKPTNVIDKELNNLSLEERNALENGSWGDYNKTTKTWSNIVFSGGTIRRWLQNKISQLVSKSVESIDKVQNGTEVKIQLKNASGEVISEVVTTAERISLNKEIYIFGSDTDLTLSNNASIEDKNLIQSLTPSNTVSYVLNKKYHYVATKGWTLFKVVTSNNETITGNFSQPTTVGDYTVKKITFNVAPENLSATFTFTKN